MSTSTAPPLNVDEALGSLPTSTGGLEGELLSPAAEPQAAVASQGPRSAGSVRHFFRHLGEMFLAMMVGMWALAALDAALFAAAGTSIPDVKDSAPEVWGLLMALNMTVGMTLWMRHRRHTWAMCAEMAGAMFAPAVAAIVLFWCSVIHGTSIGPVTMAAMLPAMIAVMLLRRGEYSQPVYTHAQETVAQSR
jgi:hypothetical protein